MARSIITAQERADTNIATNAIVFVTDDNPVTLDEYNCLGFALGLRCNIQLERTDASALLTRLGFQQRGHSLSPTDKGVALFSPEGNWHVAKHLRDGWYESKCYDRLRVVHRLDAFTDEGYGSKVHSYWSFDDESEIAMHKLNVALWEDLFGASLATLPRVEDSARILDTILLTHLIDNLRAPTPTTP